MKLLDARFGDARLPDRFWNKVGVDQESGCWLWVASCGSRGYGQFSWQGRMRLAHRAAYETLIGPIPDRLDCDHLCRVRHCVNPAHIEPVTHRENILRGETIPAKHAAKSHCHAGHEYVGDNLHVGPDGWRHCRACKRERDRTYYARRRAPRNT